MPLPSYITEAFDSSKNNPDMENLQHLIGLLLPYTEEPGGLENIDFQDELISVWLKTCLIAMTFTGDFHLSHVDIESVGKMIGNDETIQKLIEDADTARMLSFVCLAAVAYYNDGSKNASHDAVVDALSLWTGQTLRDDESLTVENITKLLYGPAVYTLYRADVIDDKDLPGHLCCENVALVEPNKPSARIKLASIVDLPGDLSKDS